jgi:hypothetical protein
VSRVTGIPLKIADIGVMEFRNRCLIVMYINLCPLPTALAEISAQAADGRLTLTDCYGLKATLLKPTLNEDERGTIDRLLYAVRRGRLQVERSLAH